MSKLAALAIAMLFCTSPLFAQDAIIRMQVAASRGSNIDAGASTFIERVNTLLTGVRLTRVETTGQTLARVRSGEVDLALVPSTQLAASDATSMAVFELPFFFADLSEVRAFQVAGLGDSILANVARVGVVGLAYWNSGMNQLASVQTASASPQRVGDLLGRKIITNVSPIGAQAAQSIGLSPTPMAAVDAPTALRQGAADHAELSATFFRQLSQADQPAFVAEVNYRPLVWLVVANPRFWKEASPRVQTAIADESRKLARELTETAITSDRNTWVSLRTQSGGASFVSYSRDQQLRFGSEAEVGWRQVESLQRGRLLDDALATRAAIRVSPTPDRRGDVRRDGTSQLLFATDRRLFEDVEPGLRLGASRGDMLFGVATLTTASGRVGLADLSASTSAASFEQSLAQQLASLPTKRLLLYVHGYNNTFVDAVATAKGIIDVTGFTGVPVLFSWPSDGKALNYPADEEEMRTSRNGFIDVLQRLQRVPGVERLSIVAHSMGSRLMIESLDRMSLLPEVERAKLHDLVLAAADADVTLFDQTRVAVVNQSKRLTLYASEWDQPLRCSRWLHSGVQNKPRLGQGGADVTVVTGVETVDASPVEKTLLTLPCASAHAYVIHNGLVGNDLRELISLEKAAAARNGLQQTARNGLPYWLVKP